MNIALIAAVSENGVIGRGGRVPWHIPAEIQIFKRLTMGHALIVGRTTYESIGKPLPGRTMIVLTRKIRYKASGCRIARSLKQALAMADKEGTGEIFIAGGAQVYARALPLAQRIYLSIVHLEITGDTFFPKFDEGEWDETERTEYPVSEEQKIAFTFRVLERKGRKNGFNNGG